MENCTSVLLKYNNRQEYESMYENDHFGLFIGMFHCPPGNIEGEGEILAQTHIRWVGSYRTKQKGLQNNSGPMLLLLLAFIAISCEQS